MIAAALLIAPLLVATARQESPSEPTAGEDAPSTKPAFENPYFSETEWRVWRDDETPIEELPSLAREDGKEVHVSVTLAPREQAQRTYPEDSARSADEGPHLIFAARAEPSPRHAGIWDDVYSSWSNLHGYVRSNWRGVDGSKVDVRGQIIHFVDVDHTKMMSAGVNFVHQSTTGMAHTITNGYSTPMTTNYERLYFADCLVTSPAHNSFTDLRADRSSDLFIAHSSTLFNSVGSSNSETMAITKMIIIGGYLPPATKLLLKRNGSYPGALLSIWKASLPYDVPYDHELRHRVAYKSVGNRADYPEKYSAAGIDKGDRSLAFHQYDDLAHMLAMIDMASSMDVAPPEAIFEVSNEGPGSLRLALKKSAVVIQEEGQDVEVNVSTAGCYDLQGLPLTTRWKLLYGNRATRVTPDPLDPTRFTIRVPWDAALPEGRTAIALIANNGRFDSNPAILTVYRKKSDLPPSGQTPADYKFPLTYSNRRPILLGLQDQVVRPGKQLRVPLHAIDPEGFPVTFYKRAGEVGELDGNLFVWDCPRKQAEGTRTVTIIASDGTSGNSYAGRQFNVHIGKPELMARITADELFGEAPLEVHFSARESSGRNSKTKFGWEVREAQAKVDEKAFENLEQGREYVHTFERPGLYSVHLTLHGPKDQQDSETLDIWVTDGAPDPASDSIYIEGNGVRIPGDGRPPSRFDHTDLGSLTVGESLIRTYRISNLTPAAVRLTGKKGIRLAGPDAADFKVVDRPRLPLDAGDASSFSIRFKPRHAGERRARVLVGSGSQQVEFEIGGTGIEAGE